MYPAYIASFNLNTMSQLWLRSILWADNTYQGIKYIGEVKSLAQQGDRLLVLL